MSSTLIHLGSVLGYNAQTTRLIGMAMTHSVALKIDQAKRHLKNLEIEVRSYLSRNPIVVVSDEEPSSGDVVYTLRIMEKVPEHWGAIIGDVIHNLRSALDHLACELVVANGQAVTRNTVFPISEDVHKFRAHALKALNGVSKIAYSTVERLKPYKWGNLDLWQIHKLDIIDRHRMIVPVCVAYENVTVTSVTIDAMSPDPIASSSFRLSPFGCQFPLGNGSEVFREKSATRKPRGPNFDNRFTFLVAFGETNIVDAEDVLHTLRRYVTVVEQTAGDITAQVSLF